MKTLNIALLFIICLILCIFIPALAGQIKNATDKFFICVLGGFFYFFAGICAFAEADDFCENIKKKDTFQFVGLSFLLGMSIFVLRLFI